MKYKNHIHSNQYSLRTLWLFLGMLGFVAVVIGQNPQHYNGRISVFLDTLQQQNFNGTILVAHNDSVIQNRTYGFSNFEHAVSIKPETKFNLASITKMFTAVGILKLVDTGKLKLNDTVGMYLPQYANDTIRNSCTIHHLLTHTSGLGNFYVDKAFTSFDKSKLNTTADFLALFEQLPLQFFPGSKYAYGASGFVVLGLIIEAVTGLPYDEYMQEEVFQIAEMTNTKAFPIDKVVANKADGYTSLFGDNEEFTHNTGYLSKASPGGFYYSTAKDLFEFSKHLRNYTFFSEEILNVMCAPHTQGYYTQLGYAVSVDTRFNQTIIGHSGGWYGVQTELMDFTKDNYTVIILSNVDTAESKGTVMVSQFFKNLIAGKPL